jgi:hypothetical protein
MSRMIGIRSLVLATLSACGSAYADRVPIETRPHPRAAFHVDLVDEMGQSLRTYRHRGRFYVLGEVGQRYSVRVTNPTAQRVEAVISIDGLDAVDGRTADFVHKRGYVVPAYGTLSVDGFRVSLDDVATFRFSSVPSSYAGRKGQARHVGVVGVAIFQERYQEPVYLPTPTEPYYDDEERERSHGRAPAPSPPSRDKSAPSAESAAPSTASRGEACCDESPTARPGLGTEFGERRSSAVSYVSFARANPARPMAIVEIRYNDRDGLAALGIPMGPVPPNDLHLRETANPFPHSPYAPPPAGWY